ncbi:Gamma-aminobutyric acid A receptor/Glycine receptor alpha family and Neurotransmitter-gated ion-channel transmembrane domain and Neurotransmitter-gated ion-channel family and Neurotransmitter-gated ion-channel ligand-binding domain-containing protein [Strongyloides ratti]|uniref:Neur_chan_LBD domain-containing protein n=1 Tax=Strongyloides ratti TaxID=34506 RepID=A0A090LHT0_STRRB|nr:Gamma-aminobutyric acid A receptor/Glycine receptor alpha family and Neurotransmitter-gated ion-channel transmembrane domain and Neurotransmitter-gated ion-channel family and Neurotransmitter-gated ion-channel ligand-binding domain-containing protein [Strongyloides ratti]CEF69297.1 Gamma-aminobutyric acid A receptor/Glycine receptor alpha family and Neurotransmitter-gated ion-channel transmembrane domain and Neurotransmitter-gated ion-channel family and Neurotransmitter-gated ion-channel ligand
MLIKLWSILICFHFYVYCSEENETIINIDETIQRVKSQYRYKNSLLLHSKYVIPIIRKRNYDEKVQPLFYANKTLEVKMGVQIMSLSNFQLDSMDFNMDVWFRLAWYDPRLTHDYELPILINDYHVLKQIWKPDPFILNVRDAKFHLISYQHSYAILFQDGVVFYEVHIKATPSCQLVLCKYPHDSQQCSLKISSIGYNNDSLHLTWFSKASEAVKVDENVQLPDFYLKSHIFSKCDGSRKTGNYSCIEVKFNLKRNLGYHIAQTYIPVAMCVIFSWISVWLPEEFIEAESTSAKEILPRVGYIKAIDIWFGILCTFVFMTVIQAIIVISLEFSSRSLRDKLLSEHTYHDNQHRYKIARKCVCYHRMALKLDIICRIAYPVIFLIFLFIYFFIVIEGKDNKCLI